MPPITTTMKAKISSDVPCAGETVPKCTPASTPASAAAAPPIAKTSVNALRTSMPSAVTISRSSTPARMTRPNRVQRRKASSPASTTHRADDRAAAGQFGTEAPPMGVTCRCPRRPRERTRVGAPDRLQQRDAGQRQPDGDQHLLDGALVQRPDQHQLHQRRDRRAGDHAERRPRARTRSPRRRRRAGSPRPTRSRTRRRTGTARARS